MISLAYNITHLQPKKQPYRKCRYVYMSTCACTCSCVCGLVPKGVCGTNVKRGSQQAIRLTVHDLFMRMASSLLPSCYGTQSPIHFGRFHLSQRRARIRNFPNVSAWHMSRAMCWNVVLYCRTKKKDWTPEPSWQRNHLPRRQC